MDVFASGEPTPAQESPVNDLVGDGKKFKSVEDLAKGKLEADAHIARLNAEIENLRIAAERAASVEKQLAELKESLKQKEQVPGGQPREQTAPSLGERDIEALVERAVTAKEAKKTANQNINDANARAVKHFGSVENANAQVRAKAKELGMDVSELKAIAAKSPTAFMQMLGATAPAAAPTAPSMIQSSVAPPVVQGGGSNLTPGTYEYAEHVRRTNPVLYWDGNFQMKNIFEAAKAGTYVIPAGKGN